MPRHAIESQAIVYAWRRETCVAHRLLSGQCWFNLDALRQALARRGRLRTSEKGKGVRPSARIETRRPMAAALELGKRPNSAKCCSRRQAQPCA
eukprot:6204948-Pleurochrysis_carterae.AAC.1